MTNFKRRILSARSGFTLVELVLVLVVMSILATVAIQMFEPQVDQAKFDATQSLVENVNRAILSEQRDSSGAVLLSGFFVDTGGLPRVASESIDGQAVFTLGELFRRPTSSSGSSRDILPFKLRSAISTNVSNVDSSGDGKVNGANDQPIAYDSTVIVGSGWNGPYLSNPVGAGTVMDGWGYKMVSFPGIDDSVQYNHLRTEDSDSDSDDFDEPANSAGAKIQGIRSLGRSNSAAAGIDYELDFPSFDMHVAVREGRLFGTVAGVVTVSQTVTGVSGVLSSDSDKLVVQFYFPDGETGKIRIERADIDSVQTNSAGDYLFSYSLGAGLGAATLPVGVRLVKAYFDNELDQDISLDPKSALQLITIQPGNNSGPSLYIR